MREEGSNFEQQHSSTQTPPPLQNIRRRVYDALNVLMALHVIAKEKKEIRWIGLPNNSERESEALQADIEAKEEIIEKKKDHLKELIIQVRGSSALSRGVRT